MNSKPKTNQQDAQVVPRAHAADTRAVKLSSIHSNATRATTPNTRRPKTRRPAGPGPRTQQVTAPRLFFLMRAIGFGLSHEGEPAEILRRSAASHQHLSSHHCVAIHITVAPRAVGTFYLSSGGGGRGGDSNCPR